MPARSTAYYLLLKHTSRTVDSYCSFLDIHLLRTPPCYMQLALHLVEGRRATTGTYPSCLALIRPGNEAAPLALRAQPGRKEQRDCVRQARPKEVLRPTCGQPVREVVPLRSDLLHTLLLHGTRVPGQANSQSG